MKKKPNKLPFELHDPKLPTLNAGEPLDLSDQLPDQQAQSVLPQPMQQGDCNMQTPQAF